MGLTGGALSDELQLKLVALAQETDEWLSGGGGSLWVRPAAIRFVVCDAVASSARGVALSRKGLSERCWSARFLASGWVILTGVASFLQTLPEASGVRGHVTAIEKACGAGVDAAPAGDQAATAATTGAASSGGISAAADDNSAAAAMMIVAPSPGGGSSLMVEVAY